jgi:hypothetical protein
MIPEVPLKRYNNLKCHRSQLTAKGHFEKNKNAFLNDSERLKQQYNKLEQHILKIVINCLNSYICSYLEF